MLHVHDDTAIAIVLSVTKNEKNRIVKWSDRVKKKKKYKSIGKQFLRKRKKVEKRVFDKSVYTR